MSEVVKILWSGVTGRTGLEAVKAAESRDDVAIVVGLSRYERDQHADIAGRLGSLKIWTSYDRSGAALFEMAEDVDVIVDFSHPKVFSRVLNLALQLKKPFVSETSGIYTWQKSEMLDAGQYIPIYGGGNFFFQIKQLLDTAVELSRGETGALELYENFYEGKRLPSEISRVMRQRIRETANKPLKVHSKTPYPVESLRCDWRFDTGNGDEPVRCVMDGFGELANNILDIAKIMTTKPAKGKKEIYILDDLWPEIKTLQNPC